MMIEPQILQAEPELADRLRVSLGLDKPMPVRYALWLSNVIRGNLGYRITNGRAVLDEIVAHVGPTLQLAGLALLFSTFLGVVFGVLAGSKQHSLVDNALTVFGFLSLSIPSFFFAILAILFFSIHLEWLPTHGAVSVGERSSFFGAIPHLVLPVTILSLDMTASVMRYMRSSLLSVLSKDYILAARARGCPFWLAIWRHALRNSLLPVVTIVGMRVPMLFGGAVIIERVFSWPGLGNEFVYAVADRDFPMLMGITLVLSLFIVVSTLAVDLVYLIIDPRIRYAR